MSRLVERAARRLAQPGRAVPPVEPSETYTALITRRQASRRGRPDDHRCDGARPMDR
jgi:hypothetical protein